MAQKKEDIETDQEDCMMAKKRASAFDGNADDLSDFEPKPKPGRAAARGVKPATAPALDQAAIRKMAGRSGFTSREPRRWRTGRDTQLNTRVRAEYKDRFYLLADRLGVTLGKTLECTIDALEANEADKS